MTFQYWLIENNNTSCNERVIGTAEELEIYLESHPHLCNPRAVEYTDEFEDCIDLGYENICAASGTSVDWC